VPLQNAQSVILVRIEDGILHAERIEHALLEEIRVSLAAGICERRAEQVEAIMV
jgi:hypothetical protein